MKEGWEYVPLSSFAKTSAGGTPLKSNQNYYLNGTVPWLLSGEVGTRDILESTNFITELGLANSSAKLFPSNTVLVAMYGATAGEAGLLRFEASTNQAVCGIFPSEKHIPEYLYYFFLHFKGELVKQAVGNAQPNISQQKIKNTEIPLPPIEEQKCIVAVLDKAFAGLETARANAEENLKSIREMFVSSLQLKLGNIKPGWELKRLGDLVTLNYGKALDKSQRSLVGPVPTYGANGIKDYTERFDYTGPTLIVGRKGSAGAITRVDNQFWPLDVTYYTTHNEDLITFDYLEYLLNSLNLPSLAKGVKPGINRDDVYKLNTTLPPIEEQKRIVAFLDELRAETSSLKELYQIQLYNITELRQSLLQKAFAGELT